MAPTFEAHAPAPVGKAGIVSDQKVNAILAGQDGGMVIAQFFLTRYLWWFSPNAPQISILPQNGNPVVLRL
jgi:hypothetical protein